jgi:energy-coupling factor transporter ATP-binding protein EcfA2
MSAPSTAEELLAIEVRGLTFTYTQGAESSPIKPEQTLEDIDLLLAKGARCLLIGANGCESSLFLDLGLGLIPW